MTELEADATPGISRKRSTISRYTPLRCVFWTLAGITLAPITRTLWRLKPRSVFSRFRKVPRNKVAPTSSMSDRATWPVTSALPRLNREVPATIPRACSFSIWLGRIFVAQRRRQSAQQPGQDRHADGEREYAEIRRDVQLKLVASLRKQADQQRAAPN